MASVTTTNASTSTTGIDVSAIVTQLMDVARIPLDKLNSSIASTQTVISDLGILKSKISSFKDALNSLESPSSYSNTSTVSSNPTVVSASSNAGASIARYNLGVNQTAEASNISIKGFASATQAVTFPANGDGFSINIGSNIYQSKNANVGSSTGQTTPALNAGTLTELKDWINKIATNNAQNFSADIVQTATNAFALVISGTKTGVSNAVSFSGLNGYSVENATNTSTTTATVKLNGLIDNTNNVVSVNSIARDSLLEVNGLVFQRSSNSITDAIPNVTFNLISSVAPGGVPNTAVINVGSGIDNSSALIKTFIDSYNTMISQHKTMTANKTNSPTASAGSMGNEANTLAFIDEIKYKISSGFLTSTNQTLSMISLGMDLQIDGTIKFNSANYSLGVAKGVVDNLKSGISVGGAVGLTSNLSSFIGSIINPGGILPSTILNKNKTITSTQTKVSFLNNQLSQLQKSYTTQYSTLNTQLYNLSQVSSQLTSSLTAVTNINKGNQ